MIDLSHQIQPGMQVFPGDPGVTVRSALKVEHDGVSVTELGFGSHTGTHLDAPSHTVEGGRSLDDVSLDELCGVALVIDAERNGILRDYQPLGAEELELDRLAGVPAIVIVKTGWSRFFGEMRYLRHPFITGNAADRLWQLGMRLLAVDVLNPDRTPTDEQEAEFAVHEAVLGRDGLIVENLCHLDRLGERRYVGFFPLPLGGSDGAPVRAVAFEGEPSAA